MNAPSSDKRPMSRPRFRSVWSGRGWRGGERTSFAACPKDRLHRPSEQVGSVLPSDSTCRMDRDHRHMVNRRWGTVAGILVTCGLLAGCVPDGGYAYETRADDMTGSWSAGRGLATRLELASDGTATGVAWPRSVMCAGQDAERSDELPKSTTVDFGGDWKFYAGKPGTSLPDIQLSVPADVCPDGSPHGFLWRDPGGLRSRQLPSGQDVDSSGRRQRAASHGRALCVMPRWVGSPVEHCRASLRVFPCPGSPSAAQSFSSPPRTTLRLAPPLPPTTRCDKS